MEYTKIIIGLFIASLFFTTNPVSSQNQEEIDEEILDQQLESLIEYFETAESLMDEQDFEKAIDFYDKVLEIDETFTDALNGKARALDNLGQHDQAIEFYNKVLEIDQTDIDALNGKALALESLGKLEEAISNLEKIVELTPTETIEEVLIAEQQEQPIAENGETSEIDQTSIVIVSIFVAILVIVIVVDFVARKKKNVADKAPEQGQKTERKYSGK